MRSTTQNGDFDLLKCFVVAKIQTIFEPTNKKRKKMDTKNTYPRTTRHTLLDTTINANSVQELNEKLIALDLSDEADVTIEAHIYGINREVITEAEYQKDCEDARIILSQFEQ